MSSLTTGALIVIFIACAIAIWMAGVRLASATDELDDHFGLGEGARGLDPALDRRQPPRTCHHDLGRRGRQPRPRRRQW
jgi:hypothetical protein